MNYQVVVAGAGPVGLWLAGELRRAGITVAVIEPRSERDPRSRALTVHPRTIETFASRGAHQPFLSEGIPLPGGHFGALASRLDFHRLPSAFPHTLALPQERTEALLEGQALDLGAHILRGHEVTGFTEHPEHIAVHTAGPHGPSTLQAAYLVGCDGARSIVRTAAGIDYPGTPSTVLGWLGDVVLGNPPAPGYSYFGPAGALMAVPMPGGIHRLVGITPATSPPPGPATSPWTNCAKTSSPWPAPTSAYATRPGSPATATPPASPTSTVRAASSSPETPPTSTSPPAASA